MLTDFNDIVVDGNVPD